MPAFPIAFLEELDPRLSRAQALAREIQRVALDASVHDAGEELNLIDALADALDARLRDMLQDAEAARQCMLNAAQGFDAVAEALAERDSAND
ncbi:MAG: hypothetical protein ACU0AT_13140 [Tranquillimonas sp.]